jgi:hypothetical protein
MARKADDATDDETTGDQKTGDQKTEQPKRRRTASMSASVAKARTRAAQVIWIICVIAALVLASSALCIALKANAGNGLVKFLEQTADKLDFGVFSRKNGVAHFKGHSHAADTKNALVNWGLAALVWLIGGRILERIVKP